MRKIVCKPTRVRPYAVIEDGRTLARFYDLNDANRWVADLERRERIREETARIVAAGKCPICGRALRRNLALTGWWQCSQFGADGFRADNTQPACNWQAFTA